MAGDASGWTAYYYSCTVITGNFASDLLACLAGSLLFWLTVAGMAIRSLRIDFMRLEHFLSDTYFMLDRANFTVRSVSKFVIQRLMAIVYGAEHTRVVLITLITCVSINVFGVWGMEMDWVRNKDVISSEIEAVIKNLSPEYHSLSYSPAGRSLLMKSHSQASARVGGRYFHNDDLSIATRETYNHFREEYVDFVYHHNLYYQDSLESMFGTPHSDISWFNQDSRLFETVIYSIGFNVALHVLAVEATIAAFNALLTRKYILSMSYFLGILACFSVSFVSYDTFLHGFILGGFQLVIFPISAGLFGVLTYFSFHYLLRLTAVLPWKAFWRCLIISMTVFGGYKFYPLIHFAVLVAWQALLQHYTDIYIAALGIDLKTMILSMPALYPAIALASVPVWITICKIIFTVSKNVLLGQVYGASVLSGGTFFVGFLTTIVTATAALVSLWSMSRSLLPSR